ncbi:MAG: amidohydrolase family protein [Anaerolineae bacterium]
MPHHLSVQEFTPRPELVVPEHLVTHSKFPAIDAHNHLPAGDPRFEGEGLARVVYNMDTVSVQTIVNLSGGTGDALKRRIETLDAAYPGRFVTFCNVDWSDLGTPGWTERAVAALEEDVRAGARGLKIFKELGLRIRDTEGHLVMPDDERLAPLWDAAGGLQIPVLIHSADPTAFFRPLDRLNERWDELQRHPDWHFYGPEFPSFEELIESLYRTIEAHPGTTFITAHVGCYPENLAFVSQMLDRYPNMYTDFSARIAELGRAPYSARSWFLRYTDRILFGTDESPEIITFQTYFRFLETADEHFEYAPGSEIPPQGRWRIYGVYLPDEVLRQIYYDNAARLLRLT